MTDDISKVGGVDERDYYSTFYVVLSWVPKFPALVSILASIYIIQDILRSSRRRHKMTNRIMIGLSAADIGYAVSHFVSTWAVPAGQVYGSIGNVATCTAQGFVNVSFYHMGSFFNAALAITYVLMVRYGWNEDAFGRNNKYKVRYLLLGIPPILGIAVAFPSIPQQNFNYTGQWLCSGGPWPIGCDDNTLPCQRGESMTDMFQSTACFVMCFWLAVLCSTIIISSMLCLYCTVRANDMTMARYEFQRNDTSPSLAFGSRSHSGAPVVSRTGTSTARRKRRANSVAVQGILYVWAYLIASAAFLLMDVDKKNFSNGFDVMNALIAPLQGLLNVIVYLRPRVLAHDRRRDRDNASIWKLLPRPILYCNYMHDRIRSCLSASCCWRRTANTTSDDNSINKNNIEAVSADATGEGSGDQEPCTDEGEEPVSMFLLPLVPRVPSPVVGPSGAISSESTGGDAAGNRNAVVDKGLKNMKGAEDPVGSTLPLHAPSSSSIDCSISVDNDHIHHASADSVDTENTVPA